MRKPLRAEVFLLPVFISFAAATELSDEEFFRVDPLCEDRSQTTLDQYGFLHISRFQSVCGQCFRAGEDTFAVLSKKGCEDVPAHYVWNSQRRMHFKAAYPNYQSQEFPGPCFRNMVEERVKHFGRINNCIECTYCDTPTGNISVYQEYVAYQSSDLYYDANSGANPTWNSLDLPLSTGSPVYYVPNACYSQSQTAGPLAASHYKNTTLHRTPTGGPDCFSSDVPVTFALTRNEKNKDAATCSWQSTPATNPPAPWNPPSNQKTEPPETICSSSSSTSSEETSSSESSESTSQSTSSDSSSSDSSSSESTSSDSTSSETSSSENSSSSESSTSEDSSSSSEESSSSDAASSDSSSSWWW